MKVGFIGLEKMGAAMATRLKNAGHEVIAVDKNSHARDKATQQGINVAADCRSAAAMLPAPRIFWLMTPPGEATENAIAELAALLTSGDIVVDGGNSDFRDTLRRSARLREKGITLVDAGVSGGTQGAREGCGLLIGAATPIVECLAPLFDALAAKGAWATAARDILPKRCITASNTR